MFMHVHLRIISQNSFAVCVCIDRGKVCVCVCAHACKMHVSYRTLLSAFFLH